MIGLAQSQTYPFWIHGSNDVRYSQSNIIPYHRFTGHSLDSIFSCTLIPLSKGYFVEPTIYECEDPHDKLMEEEIFGPIVGAYIYPDNKYKEVLDLIAETSPYALTGAVFAQDE